FPSPPLPTNFTRFPRCVSRPAKPASGDRRRFGASPAEQRFGMTAVVAALVTALAFLVAPAQAPIDTGALLRKYEPVLYFHPQEDWAPEAADAFVARARVEKQVAAGKWAAAAPPLPTSTSGCAFSPCFRFNLP